LPRQALGLALSRWPSSSLKSGRLASWHCSIFNDLAGSVRRSKSAIKRQRDNARWSRRGGGAGVHTCEHLTSAATA
jgi:hypothetical protein